MHGQLNIRTVAIVGAGAAGAVTAAAFHAENCFEQIRVFERRGTAGGTWIYDADPQPNLPIWPGLNPPEIDPPLQIPSKLPHIGPPNLQERYSKTPIYDSLTTNVPDIAMSFSDARFAYGPFAPHHIPRQYIENYFSLHKTDQFLVLNTTVEDISRVNASTSNTSERWKLTLRKYDTARHCDIWWEEYFDAVVLANGHYSVPYIPEVKGLQEFNKRYPGRVVHSKYYRSPLPHLNRKILVIGNSASGTDLTNDLLPFARSPVYQSRRSKSRWDGEDPPAGIEWKTTIKEFQRDGRIVFDNDTVLDEVDTVIYCTGYKASFPFWNARNNGRALWDYKKNKLIKGYWHTFFQDFHNLGIVGMPRVLTFRSFEYQAIALARLFSGRQARELPPLDEQERWETEREHRTAQNRTKFHDIPWDNGETLEWLELMYRIAGLGTLKGEGRTPPELSKETIWAIENLRKYPEPGKQRPKKINGEGRKHITDGLSARRISDEWILLEEQHKDLLSYI